MTLPKDDDDDDDDNDDDDNNNNNNDNNKLIFVPVNNQKHGAVKMHNQVIKKINTK